MPKLKEIIQNIDSAIVSEYHKAIVWIPLHQAFSFGVVGLVAGFLLAKWL